jgi:hypothetical protein
MNKLLAAYLLVVSACAQVPPALRGTVTDPSGAAVPGAEVQARGPGGNRRERSNSSGQFVFRSLRPGNYQVRIAARGFAARSEQITVRVPTILDVQLAIQPDKTVINVEDSLSNVSAAAESNSGALVLRARQLAALSDDPDELALELQTLAGPAPGPDGGQVFVDGFSSGGLPPKASIREVRINSNPYSPEYDRPGFARIDVFTKPGSEAIRGDVFGQFNDAVLNTRNPLLTATSRPPFGTQLYGLNLTGPIQKNKASFTFNLEVHKIDENAFILATALDHNLQPALINQALQTPQTGVNWTPRIDYAVNARNVLSVRYQDRWLDLDNQGAGDFSLASRAYSERQTERVLQLTETDTLSAHLVNEARFQYLRSTVLDTVANNAPAINVQGAFSGGGATIGNSGSVTNALELSNVTIFAAGRHTFKWGGRVRQAFLESTSRNNFEGTYTFLTLADYQKTLELEQTGLSAAQIRQLGFGPWQFSLNSGIPTTRVSQADAALFFSDDWRIRPNLTVSGGLRYETQTNYGDLSNFAPRVGLAWGIDGRGGRPARTVLRTGAGIFYDRLPLTLALNSLRYNGATQQSFTISDPAFFPTIPSADVLAATRQPQQLRPVFSAIRAPRTDQASIALERQLNKYAKLSVSWIETRGQHLLDVRNINAPIAGDYPFGDPSIRLLSESAGASHAHQLVVNTNISYRKLVVFGYYVLSYAKDDNETLPADPYNLRAEWGAASWGDIRHRVALGATVPLRWGFTVYPILFSSSGQPYNITTGLDPNNTGFPAARPSLLENAAASCTGSTFVYAAGYGCFDLNPPSGSPTVPHNFGRGPVDVNLALRLARTWAFGSERRRNFTITASSLNALNHPNFAPPDGDLSSPYFGEYRSLGGVLVIAHGGAPSTYNRKIDLQVRFTF